MSSLWDVPQYLIMAFSLALDAPAEKASRVSFSSHPMQATAAAAGSTSVPSEDVWLRAVKAASPHSDVLQSYGARIFKTSTGRYYVATPTERSEILALRFNPDISVRVLSAATKAMQQDLHARSHHEPTRGALVIAHMMGPDAALRYMRALEHAPQARALSVMPSFNAMIESDQDITIERLEVRLARAARARETEVAADAGSASIKGTLTKPEVAAAEKLASR